jgi:selenocysteine-specific elongation factor
MIVGTAGHIDHGKTGLVKALTGVDADRLPEEKSRGITLDLGFAYATLGSGEVLGFVDVPGHEKLIHNMLAGAGGIDFVLLVVAADDGPMPQTVEHLEIIQLLGLSRGAVALTKIDAVSPERVDEVRAGIAKMLAGSGLDDAPVFAVSNVTGAGVGELREYLELQASQPMAKRPGDYFRLAVDRVFTLTGIGTIATGAVHTGEAAIGEELTISPRGFAVQVRGMHVQNVPAGRAPAGSRCALNLVAPRFDRSRIERGDWLVHPALHAPVQRFDAQLNLPRTEQVRLRDGATAQCFLGTARVHCRVMVLEGEKPDHGGPLLAQVVLAREIGALAGDRFVLRDPALQRNLAGGIVCDPFPVARRRRSPAQLAYLRAAASLDPFAAFSAALEATAAGLDVRRFALAWNMHPDKFARVLNAKTVERAGAAWAFSSSAWTGLRQAVLQRVVEEHARAPEMVGISRERLRRMVAPDASQAAIDALVEDLVDEGLLVRAGPWVHHPDHRVSLKPHEVGIWEQVRPMLSDSGFNPPRMREIASQLGLEEDAVASMFTNAARIGTVFRVADGHYFPAQTIAELAHVARSVEREFGGIDAARYRDRIGTGRKLATEILEFFDRTGFTRRVKDSHRLRNAQLFD